MSREQGLERFSYLKPFIFESSDRGNWFEPVSNTKISEAEDRLRFAFPSELKKFYLEIGYGFFTKSFLERDTSGMDYSNRLLDPLSIADIMLLGYESGQLHPDVEFKPGDMPFFEVDGGDTFLFMRPQSEKPNAVYGMLGELIEEDFEKFIWRLYYESPTFYMENWGKGVKEYGTKVPRDIEYMVGLTEEKLQQELEIARRELVYILARKELRKKFKNRISECDFKLLNQVLDSVNQHSKLYKDEITEFKALMSSIQN